MKKMIKATKSYLIEGKLVKKGSKIIVEEFDDDIDAFRNARCARLNKFRRATNDSGEVIDDVELNDDLITTDISGEDDADVVLDDVVAMRRAKARRMARIRAMRRAKAKKAEDSVEVDEDETEDKVDVKEEARRRARRMARIHAMRRAKAKKAEGDTDADEEEDEE